MYVLYHRLLVLLTIYLFLYVKCKTLANPAQCFASLFLSRDLLAREKGQKVLFKLRAQQIFVFFFAALKE